MTKSFQIRLHMLLGLIYVFMMSSPAIAGGEYDFVGNGAGRAENNVLYAHQNLYKFLENFIDHCRKSRCHLNSKQMANLVSIKHTADRQIGHPDRIILCWSKSDCPVSFQTGENQPHRIFVTLGELIYVNIPQFYSSDGKLIVQLPEIISYLVHEMGHIIGLEDHQYLDFLGNNVREIVERKLEATEISLPFSNSDVSIQMFNFESSDQQNADLNLNLGSKMVELSPAVSLGIYIWFKEHPQARLSCLNESLDNFKFQLANLHWLESANLMNAFEKRSIAIDIKIQANLLVSCTSQYGSVSETRLDSNKNEFLDITLSIPIMFGKDRSPQLAGPLHTTLNQL